MSELTAFEQKFQFDCLPWLTNWASTLHRKSCLIVAFIGAEHWQIVIQHVDSHGQLQGAKEVLDHCCVVEQICSGRDANCRQWGKILSFIVLFCSPASLQWKRLAVNRLATSLLIDWAKSLQTKLMLPPNFSIRHVKNSEVSAERLVGYYKRGSNSVSKNHISLRCQKMNPCTCLPWAWQSFPFCFVDERAAVFAKLRGASRLREAWPAHASDAKRKDKARLAGTRNCLTLLLKSQQGWTWSSWQLCCRAALLEF